MKISGENNRFLSWKAGLFFLLLFSIPFSVEYHFSPELGTDLPDEPLMVITAFVFLAAWIYRPSLLPLAVLMQPVVLLLILMLGWTGITILFSSHPWLSIKFMIAKTWYLGAFVLGGFIVFAEGKNRGKAAQWILLSMLLLVLIVLVRHGSMGFRFATINKAVFPFFRNHVNYSALLVCLLPVAFAGYKCCENKWRPWLIILLLLFMAALVFSYSRGAWLALPVGITGGWLVTRQKLFISYLLAILLVAVSIWWLNDQDRYLRFAPNYRTTVFHENFNEHWVATYQLKDVSTAERFYRWVAGVSMVKDRWVTGYGPNCFYEEYKPYAVPAFRTWVSNNEDHSTVHNYFLLTAIEQGLPGLLLLLALFGAMIRQAEIQFRTAQDEWEKWRAITLAAVVSMLLLLNFLSDLVETDKLGSVFFLCVALSMRRTDPHLHLSNKRVK